MSEVIKELSPKEVWQHFYDLNQVPRPSKKEEKVIQFMLDFGKKLGLPTEKDKVGNVIIKKPATKGFEDRKTIVLQSHLDMVCQKNNDTLFDFDTQGIQMYVDGDWVRAKGTTLGADNGMGVAAIMAILASNEIQHPAIEALFTIDEETGMTGAQGLEGGLLSGEILLNLDTENDNEIDIGCAGGVDVTATLTYQEEETKGKQLGYRIKVAGLKGGHSGMEIHLGHGNANKIMNRILYDAQKDFQIGISELNGGGLRNAIPRESEVIIALDETFEKDFIAYIEKMKAVIYKELQPVEPNFTLTIQQVDAPKKVMAKHTQKQIIAAIYTAHNGVYEMSRTIEDLVETSNNIANVQIGAGKVSIKCLTRSSVESMKFVLADALRCAFELAGCEVTFTGSYPGWQPNVSSPILGVLKTQYERLFKETPNVVACHAGLECGILGKNYPNMDMISFGPTILGAHSPDERVQISSVAKFWTYLLEILKNIPKK